MFVTTAGRTNQKMMEKAKGIASQLNINYIERNKQSVKTLQTEMNSDCIVVGKQRLELYRKDESEPFFFHPNSAMFRIKRLINGDRDPFSEAAKLSEGMSFLDCTLGLASDSIVASFLVGNSGKVIGVEGQKYLAYLVREGLKDWDPGLPIMKEAMERIKVVFQNSAEVLESMPSNSVDCVYFDPMFEESILESDGIKSLGMFALYQDLNERLICDAKRVAKQRVILKDHYKSARFAKFGFHVYQRKTAKFHFGVIEKNC